MSTRRTAPAAATVPRPGGAHEPGRRGARSARAADRAPTIIDLAAASGVSKATVSRVLNGSPRVADETRRRVMTAVESLGFQVNHAARSLRTSRTGLVGVLVPVISVFGRIVEELDRELATAGVSMLLTASRRRDPEHDVPSVEVLVGRGVDALVLAPSHDLDPVLARTLGRIRTPIVLLDREVRGLDADAVFIDQGPGIRAAVDYLCRQGRTRLGLLTRDGRTRPGRQIVARFHEAIGAAGLARDPALVREFDDLDRQTARDGVDGLLGAGADAIISTGTIEHTSIVLERLTERRLTVPRDLGLVIYGYVGGSMMAGSGLPMVAYPVDLIAQATFRLLLPRLAGSDAPPRVELVANRFVEPPAS